MIMGFNYIHKIYKRCIVCSSRRDTASHNTEAVCEVDVLEMITGGRASCQFRRKS